MRIKSPLLLWPALLFVLSACTGLPRDPVVDAMTWPTLGGRLIENNGFQHQIYYKDSNQTLTFQAATWVSRNDIRFIVFNNIGQKITEINAVENNLVMQPRRHTMRNLHLSSIFALVQFVFTPDYAETLADLRVESKPGAKSIWRDNELILEIQDKNAERPGTDVLMIHHQLHFEARLQTTAL